MGYCNRLKTFVTKLALLISAAIIAITQIAKLPAKV